MNNQVSVFRRDWSALSHTVWNWARSFRKLNVPSLVLNGLWHSGHVPLSLRTPSHTHSSKGSKSRFSINIFLCRQNFPPVTSP